MEFQLKQSDLKRALDQVALVDSDIARAINKVGYPEERRTGSPSFAHFLRIIVGQQLSVKAAATIYGRVSDALGGDIQPQALLERSTEELRALGLSRPKIGYARGLAQAVMDGSLEPDALVHLGDEEVVEKITAMKGFGRWSAEMFLLFCLGRPDVWPADDLAIQAGVQGIKGLNQRPNRKQTDALAEPWRPHRGAVAIFVWHYYAKAPLG